jgi:SAM-dependent methyltransferase
MTALAAPAAPIAAPDALYDHLSPAERYLHVTRDRALLALLRRHGIETLAGRHILELGCGDGALLRSLRLYGADAALLDAVDVDPARAARARRAVPGVRVGVADGALLPFATASFDLAFAFTLFSSVLDRDVRRHAAAEALRVLRPGGLLAVYDFSINPTNPRARPLPLRELRALFGGAVAGVERVTLAPPLVRALGGRRALCAPLERVPFLRTHLLAAVVKE